MTKAALDTWAASPREAPPAALIPTEAAVVSTAGALGTDRVSGRREIVLRIRVESTSSGRQLMLIGDADAQQSASSHVVGDQTADVASALGVAPGGRER